MLNYYAQFENNPIWILLIFQVEDVNKKFDALKDAESRAWVEERKPPPRPKKVVKVKSLCAHTLVL